MKKNPIFQEDVKRNLAYLEFETREEAKKFQEENYGKFCRTIIETQKEMEKITGYQCDYYKNALAYYLGNMHKVINDYVEARKPFGDKEWDIDVMVDKVNETIISAPVLSDNIVVYRAVEKNELDSLLFMANAYDRMCKENRLLSTTLRKQVAYDSFPDREYLLKLYVPKGVHVLGVDCFWERSEEEMLFPTGVTLKLSRRYPKRENKKTIYEFYVINN